jgi:glycosyltransferase involved in cell wall biosynthesis
MQNSLDNAHSPTQIDIPLDDVTIIIPAFNEEEGIDDTLQGLRTAFPKVKILVIDDGSSDATAKVAKSIPSVEVISHFTNKGYGASLKTGMMHAKTSMVLWFDADGQHQASDIPKIVGPVQRQECDAVLGMRGRGSAHVVKRMPGKWVLRVVSQIVARRKIPDLNCGFRCFRTEVIRRYLHILPNGFSASATSTLLMIKRGYRVQFCPIQTKMRVGTSTVKMFRDGFNTLKLISRIMILFDAFLFFTVLAAMQIIPAIIYSIIVMLNKHNGIPVLGALVFISGFLTFAIGLLSAQISEIRHELFEFRVIEKQ